MKEDYMKQYYACYYNFGNKLKLPSLFINYFQKNVQMTNLSLYITFTMNYYIRQE